MERPSRLDRADVACSLNADAPIHRLRDLLLRFPCTSLDGLRWSVLSKVYRDRFSDTAGAEHVGLAAAQEWLSDLAAFEDIGVAGDALLMLRDAVALTAGHDGQLACWPLLFQRLVEIVRREGSLQQAQALETPHEGGPLASGDNIFGQELMGVLLAQLKPLLRRHWEQDLNFERSISYFTETGNLISVKKMKHLLASLLTWRDQRLSRVHSLTIESAVDVALQVPMTLTSSPRHNDMILCCPPFRAPMCQDAQLQLHRTPQKEPCAFGPELHAQPNYGDSSPEAGDQLGENYTGISDAGNHVFSSPLGSVAQRVHTLEKENQRLKIENAELKKRLRFGADFLNAELRRLRIENAELKKRAFCPNDAVQGRPQGLTVQQMWVPAPAVLTPMVSATGSTAPKTGDSPHAGVGAGVAFPQQHAPSSTSGQASPLAHGSVTPIPHGFCYVPVAAGVMSPGGQPWPGAMPVGHQGWVAAMPVGHQGLPAGAVGLATCENATAVISPFTTSTPSDTSYQERLLPKSLFGSDPSSHVMSDAVSPVCRPGPEVAGGSPSVQLQGKDDRWSSIPSGIVDRYKAQFEAARGQGIDPGAEGVAAPGSAEVALDVLEPEFSESSSAIQSIT